MTIMTRKSLSAGVFAAFIAFAPGAYSASGNAGSGNAGSGDADFDQEQIESFATAQEEVTQIQEEYTSQIQQADEQQAAQLQKEAQQEMVSAVEDAGLSVKEFNRISQAARNDQELQEQIQNAS